jgi:hypothetical protein
MRHVSSMTAIAAILVAASVGSADARQARSYVQSADCGARLMGSEVGEARGLCVRPASARKRVRVARANDGHRPHVARRGESCGGSLLPVRASSGAIACVASKAAGKFQSFVTALEATGYRIDFMGGWRRHGSCHMCNMHPRGLAIDINQTGRNRVTRRFPSGVTALAAQHGLLHGAVWNNADAGHFELLSASPTRHAHRSLEAYASARSEPDAVTVAGSLAAQGSGAH